MIHKYHKNILQIILQELQEYFKNITRITHGFKNYKYITCNFEYFYILNKKQFCVEILLKFY